MVRFRSAMVLSVLGLLLGHGVSATGSSPTCGPGQCSTSGREMRGRDQTRGQTMIQKCNASMESFCVHGECILIADINEHHCKCEQGYSGHRCAHVELVHQQPMSKEHIILTVFCVSLTAIGIVGTLYFILNWYRKNKSVPQEMKYQEVQMAGLLTSV